MAGHDPEHVLIRRAVSGDAVAVKVLLVRSRPELCNFVARKIPADLSRILDADDIVQETHIRVFDRVETLASSRPESFHRWVMTIAVSRVRHAIKRHRAAKRGGGRIVQEYRKRSIEESTVELLTMLAGPGKTPSGSLARHEATQAVQCALTELPQHYRRAVWLVHIEGRTVQEAASEMGRTERAIHGLCRRGLKRLKEQLGDASRFLSSTG